MSEKDSLDSLRIRPEPQYTEFKKRFKSTCIRCDRTFTFKAYDFDDARFKRFCSGCRQTIGSSEYEIDFTETVGN